MNNNIDWKKYLIVLLITLGLFFTAIYLSNYFGAQKINQLKTIQDQISIDVLSSETQFSLLSELSCKNISDSVFSDELGELGNKLQWSEDNFGNTERSVLFEKILFIAGNQRLSFNQTNFRSLWSEISFHSLFLHHGG